MEGKKGGCHERRSLISQPARTQRKLLRAGIIPLNMKNNTKKKRLLLLSSSCPYQGRYFSHCENEIINFFGSNKNILFIPYAEYDRKEYTKIIKERFSEMGLEIYSVTEEPDLIGAVEDAKGIYVGGENTFRLLFELYKNKLLEPIKERVLAGIPYVGASAGAILACPTIQTTNNLATLYPPSLIALNLVPFFINPHFTDAIPRAQKIGETREERIKEFLEENKGVVVGLGEEVYLLIENSTVTLMGGTMAKVFYKNTPPVSYMPVSDASFLLNY